jgi:hypothetical protein
MVLRRGERGIERKRIRLDVRERKKRRDRRGGEDASGSLRQLRRWWAKRGADWSASRLSSNK